MEDTKNQMFQAFNELGTFLESLRLEKKDHVLLDTKLRALGSFMQKAYTETEKHAEATVSPLKSS